ncbi:hypothetical protein [Gimesia chilikensis]|uniref:hypothetical protein n=1 Tax=Gimesia chilikensis TaxID=2605989 RepID=UPI003A8F2E5E
MPNRFNTGCSCCNRCEIGFYFSIIDTVVDAFPNAHGNLVTDASLLESDVWGSSGDKPLDILYIGMPFSSPPCQPVTLPPTAHIANYVANGGKVLFVVENSILCLDTTDVNAFNNFLLYTSSSIRIKDNTTLDPNCQTNTNVVTTAVGIDAEFQGYYDTLTNGVDQINLGGSNQVTHVTGYNLLMSNDDNSKAVIVWEKVGKGFWLALGDANMIDSCIEETGLSFGDAENGKMRTLLKNFCALRGIDDL